MNSMSGMRKILFTIFFFSLFQYAMPQQENFSVKLLEEGFIYENAPFAQCHASTVVELPNGHLLAAWFGGSYERHPDVAVYTSEYNGKEWSLPVKIADGVVNDTLRYPTWNPVLFLNKNSVLYLFYKVGPSPSRWWGMYKTSADSGKTWSKEIHLPDNITGPVKNKPLMMPNGRIIAPSSTEDNDKWKGYMEISDDDGKTWKRVPVDTASPFKAIQPALLALKDGSVKALIRSNQNVILESSSFDNGESWSSLKKSNVANPNSGIDAVTLQNGLHLLVYNPAVSGNDWSDGRNRLSLAISSDGNNWQDILLLEDHPDGEYSYPAIIQAKDGTVYITYTYKRERIKYIKLKIINH